MAEPSKISSKCSWQSQGSENGGVDGCSSWDAAFCNKYIYIKNVYVFIYLYIFIFQSFNYK